MKKLFAVLTALFVSFSVFAQTTVDSANFSLDEQLQLAKQNEEQFNKMMSDYDAELSKLMTSNDINAVQNKKRIEAEKALLQEEKKAREKMKRKTEFLNSEMVAIPDRTYSMLKTEVTQKLYKEVMGENPSYHEGDDLPVEDVSWYDAIYFCNKLSEKFDLTPVYSVNGETDVSKWGYSPHQGNSIRGEIEQNTNASGFRLPAFDEWSYSAEGGENYKYAGSDNLNEVGWYKDNSGDKTHPVGQKIPNDYGLYDMTGNVWEWVWDSYYDSFRYLCGGSYGSIDGSCEVDGRSRSYADDRDYNIGFRLVCSSLVE